MVRIWGRFWISFRVRDRVRISVIVRFPVRVEF